MHRHVVQFYDTESSLSKSVCRFLKAGFSDGSPLIVFARPDHRDTFIRELREYGYAVDAAIRSGQLTLLDAKETLATFMIDSTPDRDLFFQSIGRVIEKSRLGREHLEVLAYGEMVDILREDGNHQAAIQLEELWNELAATYSFQLFCAYGMQGFCKEAHYPQFEHICRTHTEAIPTEDFMALDENKRMFEVSLLQQRSLALESEIVHRREIERSLSRALDEGREQELRLKESQRIQSFFRSIIESAEDAIISKTLDGVILSWNPGAERIFGYTAAEAIGKPVTMLIPPDHLDEEPIILDRLRRGERIEHYETQRVRKDGTIIDISLTVSPIIDDARRIIGASKIARDISLRKRIESERKDLLFRAQAAREEAEAANRIKDEFLAILSHELRTPLNAIVGWAEIMASGKGNDSVERAAEVIQRNASLQKRLIEDLLDMAGILTGKITIRTEPVDLRPLVKSSIDTLRPAAVAKAIEIEFEWTDSNHIVIGDPDRLQQVIWNLLSNSIKFTPAGGKVHLNLRSAGADLAIVISDTGEGISAEFLPFVFDRFRQGEPTTTRKHGGLGLGLALVRHIVELHGGSVAASSPGAGLGATFTVRLPAYHTQD